MQLDQATIDALTARRTAGERLTALATEAGIPWQRLDKLIRHGLPASPQATNAPETAGTAAALPGTPRIPMEVLTRFFQPKHLGEIVGQGPIVAYLRKFVASPHSTAMLFEGETGVGKTSAALAIAADLGCDVAAGDFGGLRIVASGEQTADAVRDAVSFLQFIPMQGSGWKVLVVNEADRMSPAAETIWLDRLENLPSRSLVVFTTNNLRKLSDRFQDRCMIMHFAGDSKSLAGDAGRLLQRVWRECTGRTVPPKIERRLLKDAIRDGCLSFRRLLQLTEQELLTTGGC